jgi:hypothetical protein
MQSRATLEDKCDHRTRLVGALAIGYCSLHATVASGRVRLATDGGAKIDVSRPSNSTVALAIGYLEFRN